MAPCPCPVRSRSEKHPTDYLADEKCRLCFGRGQATYINRRQEREIRTCSCVYRHVFFHSLRQFREWSLVPGLAVCTRRGRLAWSRPREEWLVDFLRTCRLHLVNEFERQFFDRYMLGQEPIVRSSRKLFHVKYGLAVRIGKALLEVSPYALYPIREYVAAVQVSR